MLKPKKINISETNIANLGSDLEKEVRKAAAETEQAWQGVGQEPGLMIWRIEKFKVVPVDPSTYGTFYTGDSYIILRTYKKKGTDALAWDVHFWLGKYTTQDEYGTAAYKTVELDDFLGGAPVQHREVQNHESNLFMQYFQPIPKYLEGGVETGFRHVGPTEYKPRLLQLKGRRRIRMRQVPLELASVNEGDIFILDLGLKVVQFNAPHAGIMEKAKGAELARALDDERGSKVEIIVFDSAADAPDEWKAVLGEGEFKPASAGGDDKKAADMGPGEKRLFRLSDASCEMVFTEVASGGDVTRDKLESSDVFILDDGAEVFAWIGKGANVAERRSAMSYAEQYLTKAGRPGWTPIARVLEGGENEVFEAQFT